MSSFISSLWPSWLSLRLWSISTSPSLLDDASPQDSKLSRPPTCVASKPASASALITISARTIPIQDSTSLDFSPRFVLPDLLGLINPVFPYGVTPHQEAAKQATARWFRSHKPMPEKRADKFLSKGDFDRFGAMIHVNADYEHFETVMMFYLWAFASDDAWDEGGVTDAFTADDVQEEVNACWRILDLEDPSTGRPETPFAAMLQDLLVRMYKTATPGCMARFRQATKEWEAEIVAQCHRRAIVDFPTVEEFIIARRKTIGQFSVEAIIEYSLDIKLPDYVFEHPTLIAMLEAACDVLTWPNDLISFNKEQAAGDYQNFVCILMHERHLSLQDAVNALCSMLAQRVRDYASLKHTLPSFGSKVDAELARYLRELEHEVHASVRWYYESHRYWRGSVELYRDLVVELFPRA